MFTKRLYLRMETVRNSLNFFTGSISDNLQKSSGHSWLVLALSALGLAVTSFFIYFALNASMIADDFSYFNIYMGFGNPVVYVTDHYMTHNGRIGQASLFAFTFAIFGKASVQIVPILLLFALISATAYLLRSFFPLGHSPWLVSHGVAALLVTGALVLSPSMFDSYLWLTSSTVYLGGLSFTLLAYCFAAYLLRSGVTPIRVALLSVLTLWAGMFTEPLAVCTGILGFAIAVWGFYSRNISARLAGLSLWVGSMAAFIIVYFSPGTAVRRRDLGIDVSLNKIVETIPYNFSLFFNNSQWWGYLLIAVAGIALYFFSSQTSWVRSSPLRLLATSGAILFLYFFGHMLVSMMGIPHLAFRSFSTPAFAVGICSFLVVLAAMSPVVKHSSEAFTLRFAGLLLALALIPGWNYIQTISSALTLRSDHLELREKSIAEQVEAKGQGSPIEIVPVRIALVSQAVDLNPNTRSQIGWAVRSISEWYGLNPDQISIVTEPSDYCLPESPLLKPELICSQVPAP